MNQSQPNSGVSINAKSISINRSQITGGEKSQTNQNMTINNDKTLFETAKDIQTLLDYFEEENFTFTEAEQKVEAAKINNPDILDAEIVTEAIKATPTLKERLQAAGEAVYIETLKMFLPPIGIAIEAVKAFKNPE